MCMMMIYSIWRSKTLSYKSSVEDFVQVAHQHNGSISVISGGTPYIVFVMTPDEMNKLKEEATHESTIQSRECDTPQ